MKPEEITRQIDNIDSKFSSTIDATQKRLLNEVLTLSKDLKVRNGQITPDIENLKLINTIKSKLNKIVLNKDYMNSVKNLLGSFEDIQQSQISYFKTISDTFTPDKKYALTKQIAIENTAQQLTESGIDANVTSKIKDILFRSVTTGGKYSDLVGEMSNFLTDNEQSLGALSRYAKTYTTDALNSFAGQNNKLMVGDIGIKWYRYVGSNIETTRCFCEQMTKKEFIHVSEFDEVLKGKFDGEQCEIYEKTGLPRGLKANTTADNLVVLCGGWGCKHQMYPIDERIVPQSIKDKLKKPL